MKGNLLKKADLLLKNKQECVWMQSQVVPYKKCDRVFECSSCSFDIRMRKIADENKELMSRGRRLSGNRGRIVFWQDRYLGLPANRRPCVHYMKARIEFRSCTNEYHCSTCDFNHYFNDQFSVHAEINPVEYLEKKGFTFPHGYYSHKGHSWLKLGEGNTVKVGIDEFAFRLLGPFDSIRTPLIGKKIKQGAPVIEVDRGDNRAAMLSPISGIVTSINSDLRDNATTAGEEPYSEGWVMTVHSDSIRKDLKNLMINDETGAFLNHEVDRLYREIENVSGPMATDGGLLSREIFSSMPELGWGRLAKEFLER